ncbi:Fe(3+)-siderophore ABC transporter permease [Pengzhenrongella frigida]|uniref:Fe(3+)-siderophore ABC transporter permease n=1 Tax=Pengzhenrongella frigida TaxID=1259133 RepID=A0A4Q5MXZ5_9MICO|nr:Fe(3+)-siderophore ABC transporter permease [Cellulomonas sp. HLT2-17]
MPGRVVRRGALSLRWQPRSVVVALGLLLLTAVVGVLAMTQGTVEVSPSDVLRGVLGTSQDATTARVVRGIRLPRFVTGVAVGAALGMAGAIFQSVSRNALGSPDIIGFTAGSATGAVLQIIVFDGGPLDVAIWAVGGGVLCAVGVYTLSMRRRTSGGYRLVLVGIGVGALLSAVNSLLLTRSDLDHALEAQLWLQGSLTARRWEQAVPVLAVLTVVGPIAAAAGRRLDLMEMGDDTATQLGLRVERERLFLVVVGVVLTAVATAAAGPISFVALAAPQLVRRLTRGTGAHLVPAAVMGSTLLVCADLLSQHVPFRWSVPVGLTTGLLGGIYLLWLLGRSGKV